MFRLNQRVCARAGLSVALMCPTRRLLNTVAPQPSDPSSSQVAQKLSAYDPNSMEVSSVESAPAPDPVMDGLPPLPDPPRHPVLPFPHKSPRGNFTPEYYVGTAGAAGHPDLLAEQLGAGRADSEWMWLKLLCFICFMSTVGTYIYGVFFPEHIRYFQDEPWSKLPKSAL